MRKLFKKIDNYFHILFYYQKIFLHLNKHNLSYKDIVYFMFILKKKNILGRFYRLIKNPPLLDITNSNFFKQIPEFTYDELCFIYISLKESIKGNRAIGPGEIFLTIFFSNVFANNHHGDLYIENIGEIELKSRIGDHGSIFASKNYNRSSFSISIKPHISLLINNLELNNEQIKELEEINTPGKNTWLIKINNIYLKFLEFGGDKELFIIGTHIILENLYPTLELDPHMYFSDDGFDYTNFLILLTRQLSNEYINTSTFEMVMFADPEGNFKTYNKEEIEPAIINGDIKISYPSDLLPRLKI